MEIAIAICNADDFRCEMVRTFGFMAYYQGAAGNRVQFIFPEGPYLDENYNQALFAAQRSGSDWLFFLEIDMEYQLNADAIGYMIECNKDVLGGVYYQGQFPFRPIVYRFIEGGIENFSEIPEGMFQCDAAGLGFTLLSKKVINAFTDEVVERMGKPFDYLMENGKIKLRQDPAFYWRLKQLGFEVWAHSGLPLAHIKKQKIKGELFEASKKMIESGAI
jgi:hypothetical protein